MIGSAALSTEALRRPFSITFQPTLTFLTNFKTLIGRRGFSWLVIEVGASLVLAASELLVATLLLSFLAQLNLVPPQTNGLFVGLSLKQFTLLLIFTGLFRSIAQYFVSQAAAEILDGTNARLRLLVLTELLGMDRPKILPSGTVNLYLSEIFPKASIFGYHLALFLSFAIQSSLILVGLLWIAPREAILGLSGVIVIGLITRKLSNKLHAQALELPRSQERLTAGIERAVRNWLPIHILRLEKAEHARLGRNIFQYLDSSSRINRLKHLAVSFSLFLGIVLLMGILYFSVRVWGSNSGAVLAFYYLFVRLVQNIAAIVNAWTNLGSNMPVVNRALEYVAKFSRREKERAFQAVAPEKVLEARQTVRPPAPPALKVDSLSFQFAGAEAPLFCDISFEIKPGTQCGIVGPSGSGKSTLLALMVGILSPTRGTIRVNDKLAEEAFLGHALRIGYVGPDPFLIRGSLIENLRYGLDFLPTDAEIESVLRVCGLESLAKTRTEGLEYRIYEGGEGISAGQKQRLALARALLMKPDLLILDEASANLDREIEAQIAETVARVKGETTVLVVSHREGLLRHADQIVRLTV